MWLAQGFRFTSNKLVKEGKQAFKSPKSIIEAACGIGKAKSESIVRAKACRHLHCDLEWLETEGLAFEPVPDRALVEEEVV